MQISIIIPIYKVEKYIERCINSVITQTFIDYEVILVDDASPDNATAIAQELLTKKNIAFQTINHKEHQSVSEARNNGVKIAQGKYLMFIDSDDTLAGNDVLERFYTTIEREKVDFVAANLNLVYSEGKSEKHTYENIPKTRIFKGNEIQKGLIHSGICVNIWNKLVNKNFFITNELYFKKGVLLEDQLWAFQLCIAANSCYSLPDHSYNYYQTNPNAITANKNDKFMRDFCTILQEISKIMDSELQETTENINDFIFHFRNKALEILTIPFVFNDKNRWEKYYKIIQKTYRASRLSKYHKRFVIPSSLAYFVFKERIKPYQFVGSKYYLKLVDLINRYNWEGKV